MSNSTSIDAAIARLHLVRELRPYRERTTSLVMLVVLPTDDGVDHWHAAACDLLKHMPVAEAIVGEDEEYNWRAAMRGDMSVSAFDIEQDSKKPKDPWTTVTFGEKRTVLLCKRGHADAVSNSPLIALADVIADINELDIDLVVRAVKDTTGSSITEAEARELLALPVKIRENLRKTGRGIQSVLARMRAMSDVLAEEAKEDRGAMKPPKKTADGPLIEDLHGYGKAKDWALDLKRDLADYQDGKIGWDDVDNGILLSGPPGCGKTTFAAALARSLGAHFIVGSYSTWLATGTGHQGDLIRSMRKAFDEARKQSTSILLIDEIDNFPQRGTGGHNEDWNRGVVNALLECLDGAIEREGVIAVGCTNDASHVDSAVRRPGRLDKHIEIPLPDPAARERILQYHLQSSLDVSPIIARTEGMTGACLEGIAKDARRAARRNGGIVTLDMLVDALPEMHILGYDDLKWIAIHELGHAVVSTALRHRELQKVVVRKEMILNADVQAGGCAAFENSLFVRKDADWWRNEICICVGSVAAEHLFFGSHADGAAHDLQQATNAATHMTAVAGMGRSLTSEGLGADLSYQRARNYHIDPEISGILDEQLKRASAIVEQYREVIERLSIELADKGELSGEYVTSAVLSHARPVQLALAV